MNKAKADNPKAIQIHIHLSEPERQWLQALQEHYDLPASNVLQMLIKRDHDRLLHQRAVEKAEETAAATGAGSGHVHPLGEIYYKEQ